jgi:hypothetical protein
MSREFCMAGRRLSTLSGHSDPYETEPPTASSFPEIYPTFAAGGGKAADHDMM